MRPNKHLGQPISAEVPDHYYSSVDIWDYDETVVAHPYMDQLKSKLVELVVKMAAESDRKITVLEVGVGSGQLARCLKPLDNVVVEISDIDPTAEEFCKNHPELNSIPFHFADFTNPTSLVDIAVNYDVVIALGVYHHIAPELRGTFLQNLARHSSLICIADEGIQKYQNEQERVNNAKKWYGFVIREAMRRGLTKLAQLERGFKMSDTNPDRSSNDDYKESPEKVAVEAVEVGLSLIDNIRIGDWDEHQGGMFIATFKKG